MKIYSFVLMSLVSKNETDCEQGLVSEKVCQMIDLKILKYWVLVEFVRKFHEKFR